ncbi:MAG: hypothetical protein AAF483_02090 [Planctomycetota bacterium]
MSSAESTPIAHAEGATKLRTHKVDVVASGLMAGLIVIGLLVFLMFIIWLTQTFTWDAGTIVITENPAGRGDRPEGFERDIEPPGAEEIEELTEPTLAETLEAVTEAATTVAASLDSVNSNSTASTSGTGRGDNRPPGPLGDGDDIIPRFERWELKFQAKGLNPYASQLDYYKIELACIGGNISTVDYASNPLASGGRKLTGSPEEENKKQRIYFMWREKNQLQQYDEQLLNRTGVTTRGRQILKFIPKDLENKLAVIELEYSKGKGHESVTEIAKTVFESRASGSGYEFAVISQRYRTPKKFGN